MLPAASASIEITELDICLARYLYNNVFNDLLNYMQYKLPFIGHIDCYSI